MDFVSLISAHGRTMPAGAPPILVAHPVFGELGVCAPKRGFIPRRGRWASTRALMRDADRETVRRLRWLEDQATSKVGRFVLAGLLAAIVKDPMALPVALGAISTYDGIVSARGSGALQDVWMAMTATQTPVTLSWYDLMAFASWTPMTNPTIVTFVNAGNAGGILDAASNGSWLSNPAGSNHKYIVSAGLTTSSITGFALAMLYDCLWAGNAVITTNATLTPTTPITVTRYANTTPGNADYAGGNMMMFTMTTTLTFSVAGTITITYTNQAGTGSRSAAWVTGTSGTLVNRIVGNTTYNTATIITSTPFVALTNSGDSGVRQISVITIAGGTITVGTVTAKIVRPLVLMPFIAANAYIEQDTTLNIGNMVELRNVSQVCGCLGWNVFSAGTTAASMSALLRTVEG